MSADHEQQGIRTGLTRANAGTAGGICKHLDYAEVADRLPADATAEDWPLLPANLERLGDALRDIGSPRSMASSSRQSSRHDDRLVAKLCGCARRKARFVRRARRALTNELKRSTAGKAVNLFHPLRLALTVRESGPETAPLFAELGRKRVVRRLEAAAR